MTNKDYKRLTNDLGSSCQLPIRVYDRLFELENAIENGTLVFLPCKVRDTVWYLNKYSYLPRIEEYVVDTVEIRQNESIRCLIWSKSEQMSTSFLDTGIGDYIFTSKESAKKALEVLKK